jgi:hypothetical protein
MVEFKQNLKSYLLLGVVNSLLIKIKTQNKIFIVEKTVHLTNITALFNKYVVLIYFWSHCYSTHRTFY